MFLDFRNEIGHTRYPDNSTYCIIRRLFFYSDLKKRKHFWQLRSLIESFLFKTFELYFCSLERTLKRVGKRKKIGYCPTEERRDTNSSTFIVKKQNAPIIVFCKICESQSTGVICKFYDNGKIQGYNHPILRSLH